MTDTPSWHDLLELVEQLNDSTYDHASVQFGDVSVRLSKTADVFVERSRNDAPVPVERSRNDAPSAPSTYVSTPTSTPTEVSVERSRNDTAANTIDAPMIGVFYRRPAPGAEPFVQPGDTVTADTTIGIVEIMKLMNPITAGQAGVIGEFLVEDGQAVEFGQPLATIN